MTMKTTRRAVLAGAAAMPALAVPAIAGAEPDPIFAAIERHRELKAADAAALKALNAFEDTLPDELNREPRCKVGPVREIHSTGDNEPDGTLVIRTKHGAETGEFYYARTYGEIERNAPKDDTRETWIGDRLAELRKDRKRLRAARARAGITPYEDALSAAQHAVYEADEELLVTAPTTIGGVVALIRYVIQDAEELMPDGEDPLLLLENCADALAAIAARGVS